MCERYHCLPDEGGLNDQDVSFLRMHRMVAVSKGELTDA